MWSEIVSAKISARGGQPTGTTALATALRIIETASPSKKICGEWPPRANAFACRKAKAAFVGSSDPQALLRSTLINNSSADV
jgi:hypothetical protein